MVKKGGGRIVQRQGAGGVTLSAEEAELQDKIAQAIALDKFVTAEKQVAKDRIGTAEKDLKLVVEELRERAIERGQKKLVCPAGSITFPSKTGKTVSAKALCVMLMAAEHDIERFWEVVKVSQKDAGGFFGANALVKGKVVTEHTEAYQGKAKFVLYVGD